MRRLARLLVCLACLVPLHLVAVSWSAATAATNPDEILKDPALEQRARALGEAAALPRLPEPVDRRFGRGPCARSAAARARAAGRRQERSGDHQLS